MIDAAARNDLQLFEQCLGLRSSVGLNYADNDVNTFLFQRLSLFEHLVGFAYTCRSAQKNFQPSPTATGFLLFMLEPPQQRIRIRAALFVHSLIPLTSSPRDMSS